MLNGRPEWNNWKMWNCCILFQKRLSVYLEQAGAELGQAQLKLGLDFTGTELGKMSGQILTNLKNSSYS